MAQHHQTSMGIPRRNDPPAYPDDADLLGQARQSLDGGDAANAFDLASDALANTPDNVEARYTAALAAARCGATTTAAAMLAPLLAREPLEPAMRVEALSLAGRLHKDHYTRLPDGFARESAARASADAYLRAYRETHDPFPGINAATMLRLAGDDAASRELAREIAGECQAPDAAPTQVTDYWLAATLGEAALLAGDNAAAGDWYRRAAQLAQSAHGDVASMRRQVLLLAGRLPIPQAVLAALVAPAVVTLTGHMIDAPGRPVPRFPPDCEAAVMNALERELERLNAGFGYCSAACGADLLFIEAMLARDAEVYVTLPFAREDFLSASVSFAGERWVTRFDRALQAATRVTYATEEAWLGDDTLFAYAADLVMGQAIGHAAQLSAPVHMLAVADPGSASATGGTLDTLRTWTSRGLAADIIDLAELRGDPRARARAIPAPAPSKASGEVLNREVRTMLFADVVGFSKLREAQAPSFFVHFLGEVARLVDQYETDLAFRNTWGDGLFLVFKSVLVAARFALALRDLVVATDWVARGLPAETSIRIALHAGPVYAAEDPIITRRNFFGTHVNRAARIEPVTAAGSVFVSEQTAALLALETDSSYACDYLGRVQLAKRFGGAVLYRLRRADQGE